MISILNSITQKQDIVELLNESIFGFNIIENFTTLSEDSFYTIKKYHLSSILCFYNPCPCGNNNFFFNKNINERCFCLQRNILRYRQKLYRLENDFFDFHIRNIDDSNLLYDIKDYIYINKIINTFRNTKIDIFFDDKINSIIESYGHTYEMVDLDKIIKLAKDIRKLEYTIYRQENFVLSKESIDLAIELTRKDF
jgi:hypothetical protein